ncbi:MAG TPA: RNA polymerase-binding protein DksA [Gammaproteobacteria bacterium]
MPAKKAGAKKRPVAKRTAAKKASASAARSTASRRKTSSRSAKRTARPATRKSSRKKVSSKRMAAAKPSVRKKKVAATGSAKKKEAPKATSLRAKEQTVKKAAPAKPAATPRPIGNVLNGPLRGFQPYQPKKGEPYMSEGQREHFRQILLAWKRELMEEVDRTVLHMKDEAANFPDPNDRATQESEFGLELRTRDRERKLLKKIDAALQRIEDGTYGYCEETGDEIGLRRLEARPVATLCVEAQERRELAERQFRDREDQYR